MMGSAGSKRVKRPTVLVMAGGTGGHVYPALSVAERLREDGTRVIWLGTHHGLEARVVPKAGIEICFVRVSGLRGKGFVSWLRAPVVLVVALWQSVLVVRRFWPNAVLGMGGFVAGPGGVAAWLLRRPLVIHEQNAVAGLTNRLLAHMATRVLEAFPGTFPPRYRASYTGNPVRREIAELPAPMKRAATRTGPLRVLVLGGSQGARVLNEVVPRALESLPESTRVEVRHQAGSAHLEETQARYTAARVQVRLEPFIEDMAEAYAWADLAICRAGAMTISELTAAGLGAILVPFPYAVDDHQTRNARYLAEAGAAFLIQQEEFNTTALGRLFAELCAARSRLLSMAKAARKLACPGATGHVAALCVEAARG